MHIQPRNRFLFGLFKAGKCYQIQWGAIFVQAYCGDNRARGAQDP